MMYDMGMSLEQQEVAETVRAGLAAAGPSFVAAHDAVASAMAARRDARAALVALVREGRAVGMGMTTIAEVAGVSRQTLYVWLAEPAGSGA